MKIPSDLPVHLRLRSKDGLKTVCFLDDERHRTLKSYNNHVKSGMIISVEKNNHHQQQITQSSETVKALPSKQTHSFNETDV